MPHAEPASLLSMPILELGQPRVVQLAVTMTILCPCEAKPTLLYVGPVGGVVHCGLCGRVYRIDEVHAHVTPEGTVDFEVPLSIGRRK